jgi:hypothetical protein
MLEKMFLHDEIYSLLDQELKLFDFNSKPSTELDFKSYYSLAFVAHIPTSQPNLRILQSPSLTYAYDYLDTVSSPSLITSKSYSRFGRELNGRITDAAERRNGLQKIIDRAVQIQSGNYGDYFLNNREDSLFNWEDSLFYGASTFYKWIGLVQKVVDSLGSTINQLLHYQVLFIALFLRFKSAHRSSSITEGVEGYTPYLTWPRPPTLT